MNSRTLRSFFLVALSMEILVTSAVTAQEPDPDDPIEREVARLRAKYPRVDDELFESYVGQLKKLSFYRVAKALEAERVRPQTDEWSRKLGLSLRLNTVPFVEQHMEREARITVGDKLYRLTTETVSVLEDTELEIVLLELWSDEENRQPQKRFAVPDSLLEELRFETVLELEVLHPLNRIVEKLEFADSFYVVMQNLCSLADVDFALTFEERRETLYMTLENVSVMHAIRLSAQVAGRELVFCRVDDDGDLMKNVGARNRRLELFEIVELDAAQRVKSRFEE